MKKRTASTPRSLAPSTRTIQAVSQNSGRSKAHQERPIDLIKPQNGHSPFIFCSPHSGRRYTEQFLKQSRVSLNNLRRLEDSYVDLLFADVPQLGSPLLCALFPRAFVDVNRARTNLDPHLIQGLEEHQNTDESLWVMAGFGVIPRVVNEGQAIYETTLSKAEAERRLVGFYDPYHTALERLIEDVRTKYGFAIIIDCHSMPSSHRPSRPQKKPDLLGEKGIGADIVLGDKYGSSCHPVLTDICEDTLRTLGYTVRRNFPYAGGYVTSHYGKPGTAVHVIQIEINRRLYLDESRIIRHEGFEEQREKMTQFAKALTRTETLASLTPTLSPRCAAE